MTLVLDSHRISSISTPNLFINNICNESIHNNTSRLFRPEVIESIYYLHYFTGDPKYRIIAAKLFDAIDHHLRVDGGFASAGPNGEKTDGAESFFIAETLKYFFLIFAPPEVMDLDHFVFNTEAHPLLIVPRPLCNSSNIAPEEVLTPYL